MRIAINGMGRIGRMVVRALFEYPRNDIELVALNAVSSSDIAAHMLRYDSVHGRFNAAVEAQGDMLSIEGRKIHCLNERDPEKLNWGGLGVDIVIEATGVFKSHARAMGHIKAGARKVLISAPSDDPDAMIVYGVNHQTLKPDHLVISAASCTTNCLAPVVDVLLDACGWKAGFMTTIHAYTLDQGLLDKSHKDLRRARAGALSMIPTSTGAARAIGKIIPALKGKIDGTAIRVPTPNVSLVDLTFLPEKKTHIEAINQAMIDAAQGRLENILACNDEPLVSVDFTHHPASSIFDLTQTSQAGENLFRVVAWYDNEWGYANRLVDLAAIIPL